MPAMCVLPAVSHATGEALAKAVLSLMGQFTNVQGVQHSRGLRRVKFRPAPKWHRWLRLIRADFDHGTGHLDQQTQKGLGTDEVKHDAYWHLPVPDLRVRKIS